MSIHSVVVCDQCGRKEEELSDHGYIYIRFRPIPAMAVGYHATINWTFHACSGECRDRLIDKVTSKNPVEVEWVSR